MYTILLVSSIGQNACLQIFLVLMLPVEDARYEKLVQRIKPFDYFDINSVLSAISGIFEQL